MTPCIHIGSQYQNTFCGVPLTMSYAFTQLEGLCGPRQNNWAFQVCMFKAFIIIGFLNINLTKEASEKTLKWFREHFWLSFLILCTTAWDVKIWFSNWIPVTQEKLILVSSILGTWNLKWSVLHQQWVGCFTCMKTAYLALFYAKDCHNLYKVALLYSHFRMWLHRIWVNADLYRKCQKVRS